MLHDVSTVAGLMKTWMSDGLGDTYRGFPFKGIGVFYGHGKVGERRRSHAYGGFIGIPPYPSPYPAYPFVRPAVRVLGTGHTSMLDSAANARVLIIYLRDVRRTCRTFAIARASASGRPLRHSGFRAFFVPGHCLPRRATLRDGVDLFRPYRHSRCLLTNRSCNSDRTRIFIAEEKSRRDHAPRRQGSEFRCAFRETRLKCQWAVLRTVWG